VEVQVAAKDEGTTSDGPGIEFTETMRGFMSLAGNWGTPYAGRRRGRK
jgi:hypothetical protein